MEGIREGMVVTCQCFPWVRGSDHAILHVCKFTLINFNFNISWVCFSTQSHFCVKMMSNSVECRWCQAQQISNPYILLSNSHWRKDLMEKIFSQTMWFWWWLKSHVVMIVANFEKKKKKTILNLVHVKDFFILFYKAFAQTLEVKYLSIHSNSSFLCPFWGQILAKNISKNYVFLPYFDIWGKIQLVQKENLVEFVTNHWTLYY